MTYQIVPATPHVAPSILLNHHAAVASAALTPDADIKARPDLNDIGTAATAMAWAMQGRLWMVRSKLRQLSPAMRHVVAEAAWRLGVLADGISTFDATQELPAIPDGVDGYPIGGQGR